MALVYLEWHEYAPAEVAGAAVTIGNFDGVHRGHQALVAAVRRHAEALGGAAVVVTFSPPPHQVLHPGSERPPLTTLPQRAQLLCEAGADHVVVLRTSPALLALSAEAFFEDVILRQLAARAVVEGYNFRFGRGRGGSNDTLRTLCHQAGIVFEEVPALRLGGEPVSSSRVRAALLCGNVRQAAEGLGRHYRIEGTVVPGACRGRTLGFPTANLADVPTVLPATGVYAVRAAAAGRWWPAAANIGPNPTFGEQTRKIEVHLIGFTGDLYGQRLAVDFVDRLRDTRPFTSVNDLVTQLQQDLQHAQGILSMGKL